MSYFIDTKYLNMVAHRLPLFTKKKKDLWNCRCIICGDSSTNKQKSRGYFYRMKNDLFYKCHNCSASQYFGTFLKALDSALYKQYVFERYSAGEGGRKAHTNAEIDFDFKEPVFSKTSVTLGSVAERLDRLDPDNEAVAYCLERKIPVDKFDLLYYISSLKNIKEIAPQYENLNSPEPRLLIPLHNERGELAGASMRALRGESLRYIMIKFGDEEQTLIFGMDKVDRSKPIYVVEGPLDSLFLDNAIACCGTSFSKIESLDLPKDQMTIIVDNQPRNVAVCKLVEKYVELGYRVCIWPCSIREKDINDMVLAGRDAKTIIAENTFQGLRAQIELTQWRNCQ